MNSLRAGYTGFLLVAAWGLVAGCGDGKDVSTTGPGSSGLSPFESGLEAAIQQATDPGSDMWVAKLVAGATPIHGPVVIAEPGAYVVDQDFAVAAGDGIVVHADHVLLSLGGHVLTGPGNKDGRGVVVEGVAHVMVADGALRTFGVGVALLGARKSAVREITVEGGDEPADPPVIPPQVGILLVNSNHNHLGWNRCELVNLGIFVRGGESSRNRIRHNEIVGDEHGLLAICYNPAEGEGPAGPSGDDVRLNLLDRFGTGIQTSVGSTRNRFSHNTIRYFVHAWQDLNGSNVFVHNQTMQVAP